MLLAGACDINPMIEISNRWQTSTVPNRTIALVQNPVVADTTTTPLLWIPRGRYKWLGSACAHLTSDSKKGHANMLTDITEPNLPTICEEMLRTITSPLYPLYPFAVNSQHSTCNFRLIVCLFTQEEVNYWITRQKRRSNHEKKTKTQMVDLNRPTILVCKYIWVLLKPELN